MLRCGLLGETLGHSYSPMIHHALGEYDYRLFEVSKEDLDAFLCSDRWDGLNVTIPYKKAVVPYCVELSEAAAKLQSVNTLVHRPDGTLYGDNTDLFGFLYMVRRSGIDPAGKKALVLGSGGASVTVKAALEQLGDDVTVISRSGPDDYDHLDRHADAQIIVNTTPVGMYPHNGAAAVDLRLFPQCEGVLDIVYNPARTALLLQAEELGIPHAGGLSMLVAQAKESAEWFTGGKIDDGVISTIYSSLWAQMENVILIGMPGCGKTTVAEELSKLTGRKAVDTDSLVEESAGMSVPEIFSQYGEKRFRELEAQAVRSAAKEKGLIIATGGGAVLDPGNVRALKGNGRIYYLKRDLNLLSLNGRPLSKSRETLDKMFKARDPIYSNCADAAINNDLSPVLTAQRIKDELGSSDI